MNKRVIPSRTVPRHGPGPGIHRALFLDVPLGNEPPGAEITLGRARLRFHRKLSPHWQVKLTADYNKGGGFEVNDSYLLFAGWQKSLVKLGFHTPPFSLESVSGSAALTFLEEALPVAALAEHRSGGVNILKRTEKSIYSASLAATNPQEDGLSGSGQAIVLHYVHSPIDFAGRKGLNMGGSFS